MHLSQSNVVPMKATRARSERIPETNWKEVIARDLRAKLRSKTTIKAMAKASGLCPSTISRLIYGESEYVHHRTIVIMMHYLGYKLFAVRA